MRKRRKIAPSILAADFSRLGKQIKLVERAGIEMIHVDVMDGHFVPNISIGPVVVSSVRKITDLTLDVHLMIENPEDYINAFVKAGADIITVHLEACMDLNAVIKQIKDHNIKAGVSIKPKTPVSAVENFLEKIDLLLIMSVEPGFGGQKFIPNSLDKLREVQSLIQSVNLTHVDVEVDGGIYLDNIKEVSDAGAEILVSGSGIFSTKDPAQSIKDMYRIVNS